MFLATSLMVDVGGSTAEEPKWGDLQMRFVYDGEPPIPRALNAPGFADLFDESLVVNQQNRGIANVAVWLRAKKENPAPVHPSYDGAAQAKVIWPIAGSRYSPHIQTARVSQTLVVRNQDRIGHVPNLNLLANAQLGHPLPAGADDTYTFGRGEPMPVKVGCNIHPWLGGWLIVQDLPYVGTSDADGRLKLSLLPVGDWEFQFWHEQRGNVKQVIVDGKQHEWPKGRRTISIQEGNSDLGEFRLSPALLNGK